MSNRINGKAMRKHLRTALFFSTIGLALQACAHSDVVVPISLDELPSAASSSDKARGTLTIRSVELETIMPPLVHLKRDEDTTPYRIGYNRNLNGAHTAYILTDRPIVDIVEEALARSLRRSGFDVSQNSNTVLQARVTDFALHHQMLAVRNELTGIVGIEVEAIDAMTGTVLAKKTFSGTHVEKVLSGYAGTSETMEKALSRAVSKISHDESILTALAN